MGSFLISPMHEYLFGADELVALCQHRRIENAHEKYYRTRERYDCGE